MGCTFAVRHGEKEHLSGLTDYFSRAYHVNVILLSLGWIGNDDCMLSLILAGDNACRRRDKI